MNLDNITPEQAEKARNLSSEELAKFVEEEGIELTDEQMDIVSGGGWKKTNTDIQCPACKKWISFDSSNGVPPRCPYCGDDWSRYAWE